jgi:hypothetical protein
MNKDDTIIIQIHAFIGSILIIHYFNNHRNGNLVHIPDKPFQQASPRVKNSIKS